MSTDVAAGDPDWQNQIDGVDVLFQKSGTSTYTLKATNPGTFKYRLSLTNETGVDVHVRGRQLPDIIRNGVAIKDANGGTTTVFLTVPSMPSSTGTPYPLSDAQKGCRPSCCPGISRCGHTRTIGPMTCRSASRISPRRRMDVRIQLLDGRPGTSRCPRTPTISPSAAFGLMGSRSASTTRRTSTWPTSSAGRTTPSAPTGAVRRSIPAQSFRAGFNFKSTTIISLDGPPADVQDRFDHQLNRLPVDVRPDYQAQVRRPVGQGLHRKPRPRAHVRGRADDRRRRVRVRPVGQWARQRHRPGCSRRPRASTGADRTTTGSNNLVASYLTGSDGFYFIWQKNLDNTGAWGRTNSLAPGFKYFIALCDLTVGGSAMPFDQLYWPARSMASTLGNKEFDEEDFFVSGPTRLTYTSQPISGRVNGRWARSRWRCSTASAT